MTMTRDRLKVEGIVGIITERRPDLFDALVNALLEIDEGIVAPELLLDLIAGHHLARPTCE